MFTQDFHDDFSAFEQRLRDGHPFAFSRYNDGEARILKNGDVGNKDGWFYHKDRDLAFRAALRHALLINHPHFFYGISSEESDAENHHYLKGQLSIPLDRMTHGNIFSLSNSGRFHQDLLPILRDSGKKLVLIASEKINQGKSREQLGDFEFFPLRGCCVTLWNRHRDHLLGRLDLAISDPSPKIFLVCAGPLAKILIHKAFELAPAHTYLDIGSSLDLTFFPKSWRADHREPEKYNHLSPRWMLPRA